MPLTTPRFALLIPVKAWSRAKSRLDVDAEQRAHLVAAFAYDAITAAAASPAVASIHVITDEAGFTAPECATPVEVLADEGDGDLNAALRAGVRRVRGATPDRPVAALLADLPALRTDDLTAALTAAPAPRWFVADADGTGTTVLAASLEAADLDPHFGRDSARRHRASGAVALDPQAFPLASLRRDVDTEADLADAIALGVGGHTTAALPEGNAAVASDLGRQLRD